MLIVACIGFSIFTALTPFGGLAFGVMLAIRFLVGAFESVSFPAYASLNSRWIPRHEYSRAQTLSVSGAYLGQVVSYPLTTWLVLSFSWPMAFYFNAAVGIVWLIAWSLFATNTPAEHPKMTQAERQEIEANMAPRSRETVSPWALLKEPHVLFLSSGLLAGVAQVEDGLLVLGIFPHAAEVNRCARIATPRQRRRGRRRSGRR